jgi:hypothetical protein
LVKCKWFTLTLSIFWYVLLPYSLCKYFLNSYMGLCECFWQDKCINYIPLVITPIYNLHQLIVGAFQSSMYFLLGRDRNHQGGKWKLDQAILVTCFHWMLYWWVGDRIHMGHLEKRTCILVYLFIFVIVESLNKFDICLLNN